MTNRFLLTVLIYVAFSLFGASCAESGSLNDKDTASSQISSDNGTESGSVDDSSTTADSDTDTTPGGDTGTDCVKDADCGGSKCCECYHEQKCSGGNCIELQAEICPDYPCCWSDAGCTARCELN